ncbi:hypothetical protein DXX98_13955 [Janibacter melonis]|nr:hypothetical protein [Janibacter melonis]
MPDPRFSRLVGQRVDGVSGGVSIDVHLERATVRFPTGVSCQAPGGVDRVAPGDDLTLVAEAVGETVVAVSESRGRLTVATQRVGVYSLARQDGPLYVVEERWSNDHHWTTETQAMGTDDRLRRDGRPDGEGVVPGARAEG